MDKSTAQHARLYRPIPLEVFPRLKDCSFTREG